MIQVSGRTVVDTNVQDVTDNGLRDPYIKTQNDTFDTQLSNSLNKTSHTIQSEGSYFYIEYLYDADNLAYRGG